MRMPLQWSSRGVPCNNSRARSAQDTVGVAQLARATGCGPVAFATLGLIQLLHAFNVKSVYQSVFKVGLFRNKTFNWAIPVAFVLLMATIVVPGFNNLFHVSHLSLTQWLAVIVGSFLIVVLVELVKAIQRALG